MRKAIRKEEQVVRQAEEREYDKEGSDEFFFKKKKIRQYPPAESLCVSVRLCTHMSARGEAPS